MYINIHTHQLKNNKDILALYNFYPWENININQTFFSVGIHPIYINDIDIDLSLQLINNYIKYNNCIAIGEIGLDKITKVNFNVQIEIFEKQLKIAEENKLPVILHCVKSYQEIFAIKSKLKLSIPLIFHGFNKNIHLLNQIYKNNCIPSFGRNLLYNKNLQTIFANNLNSMFFLENDGHKETIEEIYAKAAELKHISVEELQNLQKQNFDKIFKK